MEITVTVDDFTTYGHLMHINSIIVLSIGVFTIYLTVFHSTKEMGYYKYYILNFQLAATLFDLHISFVYSPLPILPVASMCSTSVLAKNVTWVYEYINYIIMHFTLSYVGVSIFIGLLYRYCALQGSLYFFHSKRGVAIIALGNLVYPLPVTIALLCAVENRENTLLFIKTKYPSYYELFKNNCCNALAKPTGVLIYPAVAAVQIVAVASCSGIAMFKINNLMKEKQSILTKKTYDLHRQLIYSLWVQAFLPTCFLVIPTVTAFLMVIKAFGNLRAISLTIIPILCLHSAVLGLSTIVMTKPYRQATINIIMRPFRDSITIETSVQVTGSVQVSSHSHH
uniref:Serpentine Receptor, class D (Delta) n=1 Tax=Panagrellus redivivus TaxID=6233 RepID=A0A7E4USU2_PANRE